jgi:outer membrane receptor protein involved in Fe transport
LQRKKQPQWFVRASVLALTTFAAVGGAQAQSQPAASEATVEDVVVLGSQIRGAKTTGALPVSVVNQEAIQSVAPVSAGDLFRTIPQVGDVAFNEQATGGVNSTRGDVSSVSLRGLGLGNTLLLINGRRVVLHPTSQSVTGIVDSQVPVFGYNSNAIPVAGLERLEVLRDGAAALYGSDAVAGVINNVLKSDFKGKEFTVQYGGAEDTSQTELELSGIIGKDFLDGRLNVSLFGSYAERSRLYTNDLGYLRSSDRSSFVVGTPFEGNASFDGRSSSSAWGVFQAPTSFGTIRSNGVAITSASAMFHLQPSTNPGCQFATSTPGVCYDDGNITTLAADRNTRLDSAQTFRKLTTLAGAQRVNLFSFINYELTDNLKAFSELGFYRAETSDVGGSGGVSSTTPITIAANAYYNPFGAALLPNGQPNPNRLPGLNVPASGVPLTITSYNIVDAGTREVKVTNAQYRVLGGLRGSVGKWDWESALLYNWATAKDVGDNVSNALFQAAINKTTPDAYNPFTGGDPANPSIGDSTPNPKATIDSFLITGTRATRSALTLADFKVSNANLIDLWGGGNVGVAAGVEFRRETYHDNRDVRQDGTITYTDAVTGIKYANDTGSSPSPDVRGARNVYSAYSELAASIVTPEMGIPFVRAVDVQVAGRYENFSDIGSVAKPKVAASWDPIDGIRLRTSWSQGFRAPNLEVINLKLLERSQGGRDYLFCEADLRAKRIANFAQCNRPAALVRQSIGNPNLKPEESESFSYGAVLTPPLPEGWGRLTFTVDRYKIRQLNSVGLVNAQDEANLDYLLRVRGSRDPLVQRLAPTADEVALFAGTGLAPAGQLLNLQLTFQNFLPITVEGLDLSLDYRLRGTPLGNFSVSVNSAETIRYYQAPNSIGDQLAEGQAKGEINAGVPITAGGDFVAKNGRPKWRHTVNLTWSKGPVQVGSLIRYTGKVNIIEVIDANNNPFPLKATTTVNLYVTYNFEDRDNFLNKSSLTIGARNIFDKDPPFTSAGYLASLYQPQARYWYASLKKSF